jgi:D-alanyl-D-alanine carboxypeptidase
MAVLIGAMAAYFMLVVAAAWWWSQALRVRADTPQDPSAPPGRPKALTAPSGGSERSERGGPSTSPGTGSPRPASWHRGHATARFASAALVLAGLPALAMTLRWWQPFDGYDHTVAREVNAQVAALLAGEQLVAPQPLPPALFATPEVERAWPLAATASREWALLDPEFRQRLLLTMQLMRERHGIEMVLLEGYRSEERQAQLAALGPHVTLAAAGASRHQAGLAADCAFLFDGRVIVDEKHPRAARAYALYGEVAQATGLTWGGSWRNLVDLGHVELRRPSARAHLPRA